jgi:hypothetical protein
MCTLEANLVDLIQAEVVTYDDALAISSHPKELERMLTHRQTVLTTA